MARRLGDRTRGLVMSPAFQSNQGGSVSWWLQLARAGKLSYRNTASLTLRTPREQRVSPSQVCWRTLATRNVKRNPTHLRPDAGESVVRPHAGLFRHQWNRSCHWRIYARPWAHLSGASLRELARNCEQNSVSGIVLTTGGNWPPPPSISPSRPAYAESIEHR